MKSSRYSPEQVTPVSEVCRKMGTASRPSTGGRRSSRAWAWPR